MKRKLVLLFAVLVGGMVAFVINRTQVSGENFIKVGACIGSDERICYVMTQADGSKVEVRGFFVTVSF